MSCRIHGVAASYQQENFSLLWLHGFIFTNYFALKGKKLVEVLPRSSGGVGLSFDS